MKHIRLDVLIAVIVFMLLTVLMVYVLLMAWYTDSMAAPLEGDTPPTPVVTEAVPDPTVEAHPTPTRQPPETAPTITPKPYIPPGEEVPVRHKEEKERTKDKSGLGEMPKTGFLEDVTPLLGVAAGLLIVIVVSRKIRKG